VCVCVLCVELVDAHHRLEELTLGRQGLIGSAQQSRACVKDNSCMVLYVAILCYLRDMCCHMVLYVLYSGVLCS
jgi:hypothetical protein